MAYKMKVYEVFKDATNPLVHKLKDTKIVEDWAGQQEYSFQPNSDNETKYKNCYSGALHEAWVAVPLNWDKQDLSPAAVAKEKLVNDKLVPERFHMNGHVEGAVVAQ